MTVFYNFLQTYTPYIVVPISVFGWILWGMSVIYSFKLNNHLMKNKLERWKELSKAKFSGLVIFGKNEPYFMSYVWGNEDNEDQTVCLYKTKIRLFMKWGFLLFVGPPVIFFILFVIALLGIGYNGAR